MAVREFQFLQFDFAPDPGHINGKNEILDGNDGSHVSIAGSRTFPPSRTLI